MILQLILSLSFAANAQGSVCHNYDVAGTHPEDLRVSLVIKCMRRGSDFYLDGMIDENLIFEINHFAEVPIRRLFLNSGGGKVEETFRVAEFIRVQNITTIVRSGAICKSACTLLFQAGVSRYAAQNSLFMYHGVRDPFLPRKRVKEIRECWQNPNDECLAPIERRYGELLELTQALFDLYESYGASSALRQTYWSQEEVSDWWNDGNYLRIQDWEISGEQAMEFNIVTDIIPSSEFDFGLMDGAPSST
jgi:hypothetical protein